MKVFVVDQSFFGLLYDIQFCNALAGLGHDVTLIGRELRDEEEAREAQFRMLPFFYRRSERARRAFGPRALALKGAEHALDMARLLRLVRDEKPDVVHFEWIVLPLIDRYFYRRLSALVPIIFTVHNSVAYHGGASSRLMQAGPEPVFRHVTHFIPHTESTADYLRSMGIAPERWTQVQHPAVALPSPRAPDEATADHGNPLTVLLFGALKAYKGVDILLDAAIALNERRQDFRVVIAGRPFLDMAPLQAKVEAAGLAERVIFDLRMLPDVDLAGRIDAADIVVFPYREIDASGAFACASQFGKPIIASKIGAFDEAPARNHIRHVEAGDVASLEAALEELIGQPDRRTHWAEQSQALKAAIPTWRQFAEICTTIYDNHRRS